MKTPETTSMTVAYVGGLGDTETALLQRAQPLVQGGIRVEAIEGRWFSRENAPDKVQRVADRLTQIAQGNPIVVFGGSAGGPLTIAASRELPFVRGIATAASPLTVPEKVPPLQRAIMRAFPSLAASFALYQEALPYIINKGTAQLHFRGDRDERVPPAWSMMDGAEHVLVPTPPRTIFAHTYTITTALGLPQMKDFVAQTIQTD